MSASIRSFVPHHSFVRLWKSVYKNFIHRIQTETDEKEKKRIQRGTIAGAHTHKSVHRIQSKRKQSRRLTYVSL